MPKSISTRGMAAFAEDARILIERTEESLEVARLERVDVAHQIHTRSNERKGLVEAHVQRLLPDIKHMTIGSLDDQFPRFRSWEIETAIVAARNPRVPFFTWLQGQSKQYKATVLADTLALLRVRLTVIINSLDVSRISEFKDVTDLDHEILKLHDRDRDLARTEETLRQQIAALMHAAGSSHPAPKKLVEVVSKTAKRVQEESSVADTSGTDLLLLYVIMQPTLQSMFATDAHGTIAYQPEFQPGEGDFGGGGATAGWGPEDASTASPATDIDSQGSIS